MFLCLEFVITLILLLSNLVAALEGYTYSPSQSISLSLPTAFLGALIIQLTRTGLIKWNVQERKSSFFPTDHWMRLMSPAEMWDLSPLAPKKSINVDTITGRVAGLLTPRMKWSAYLTIQPLLRVPTICLPGNLDRFLLPTFFRPGGRKSTLPSERASSRPCKGLEQVCFTVSETRFSIPSNVQFISMGDMIPPCGTPLSKIIPPVFSSARLLPISSFSGSIPMIGAFSIATNKASKPFGNGTLAIHQL